MGDVANILKDARWYSIMDIRKAYMTLPVHKDSQEYFTMNTVFGSYRYRTLPEGYKNAAQLYQAVINVILSDISDKHIYTYLDDLCLATPDKETHIALLRKIFERLRYFNIHLSGPKCQILKEKIVYLGYEISHNSMKPDPARVAAILQIPQPGTIHELRSFLGSLSFFRTNIYKISEIVAPLLALLRGKRKKNEKIVWSATTVNAFESAKTALQNAVATTFVDENDRLVVYTDASLTALAGVIAVETPEGLKPIAFYSRALSEVEKKYSIFSLELLALTNTIKRHQHLVCYRKVQVKLDCKALVSSLQNKKDNKNLNAREQRYLAFLSEFDLEFAHVSSAQNAADFFSRIILKNHTYESSLHPSPLHCNDHCNSDSDDEEERVESAEIDASVNYLSTEEVMQSMSLDIDYHEIKQAQENDAYLQECLRDDNKSGLNLSLKTYKTPGGDEIDLYVDYNCAKYRIFVPEKLANAVIKTVHNKIHLGIRRTINVIKESYIFKNVSKLVKAYVRACDACQRSKPSRKIVPIYHPYEVVSQKFEVMHLDLLKLPEARGYKYLFNCIDRYSRYVWCIPLRNIEAKTIADNFINHIMPMSGSVLRLITDKAGQFTGSLFQEVCSLLGIKHSTTTPSSPNSNGIIENYQRTIVNCLRAILSEQSKAQWIDLIPSVLLYLRTVPLDDSGITPSILMCGQNPKLPGVLVEADPAEGAESAHVYAEKLKKFFALPLSPAFTAKNRYIYVPKDLKLDKFALVRNNQYGRDKLASVYQGPYAIHRFSGNVVYLNKGGRIEPENLRNIRPYYTLAP